MEREEEKETHEWSFFADGKNLIFLFFHLFFFPLFFFHLHPPSLIKSFSFSFFLLSSLHPFHKYLFFLSHSIPFFIFLLLPSFLALSYKPKSLLASKRNLLLSLNTTTGPRLGDTSLISFPSSLSRFFSFFFTFTSRFEKQKNRKRGRR